MLGCIRFALDHFAWSAGNPITGFTQQEGHVGPIEHTSCLSVCTPSTGFTEQECCVGPIEQASGISGKRAPSVTNSVLYGSPDLHNIPYKTGQRTMGRCYVHPR